MSTIFGTRRGRHRFDEARARANDPLVLGFGADHEAGDVLHEEQRNALRGRSAR